MNDEIKETITDFRMDMERELFAIRDFTPAEKAKYEAWRKQYFRRFYWWAWKFAEWRLRPIRMWKVLFTGQCGNCDQEGYY